MKLTMSIWAGAGTGRSGFGGLRAPHLQRPGRRMQELRGYDIHHRAAFGDGGLAAAVVGAEVVMEFAKQVVSGIPSWPSPRID